MIQITIIVLNKLVLSFSAATDNLLQHELHLTLLSS